VHMRQMICYRILYSFLIFYFNVKFLE
jgi:hypothetical protein